jgi:hypothetical protein
MGSYQAAARALLGYKWSGFLQNEMTNHSAFSDYRWVHPDNMGMQSLFVHWGRGKSSPQADVFRSARKDIYIWP